MEEQARDELQKQMMTMLREMSQRQTLMFHFIREIYEEVRLPLKVVREVGEDEYLSRQGARPRGFPGKEEAEEQAQNPRADAELQHRLDEQTMMIQGMGNPDDIPVVPEGYEVTCMRCGYSWVPRIAQPTLCAKCNSPWWYAPRWRWHRKLKPDATRPRRITGRAVK